MYGCLICGVALRRMQRELVRHRTLVLSRGDVALLEHGLQHVVAARQRRFGMQQRVVLRRGLREPGDQRRLRQRQPLRRAREVGLSGSLHAERGRARVGAVGRRVQVRGEDRVLRVGVILLVGEMCLHDLAPDRLARVGDVQVAHQLLRDRRGALQRLAAGLHITPPGTDDRLHVDPALLEEVLVLDRDRAVLDPVRHALARHGLTNRLGMDHAQLRAVRGVDLRHQRLLARLQLADRRSGVIDPQEPRGSRANRPRRKHQHQAGDQHQPLHRRTTSPPPQRQARHVQPG